MPDKKEQTETKTNIFEKVESDLKAQLRRPTWTDLAEAISWLLCTCILFTFYNAVGEIASTREVAFSVPQYIDDLFYEFNRAHVPLIPHFVIPYIAVYAMPFAFLYLAIRKYGFDMGLIRRFFVVQMLLILTAFACYLLQPCKTDMLTNPVTGEIDVDISSTWIHRLNFSFCHAGISKYVSAPSMHCAHAFSIAYAFGACRLPGATLAKALAFVTIFSTFLCMPHPPPHCAAHQPAGIALAMLYHNQIFMRLEAGKVFEQNVNSALRLALIVAVPVVLHFVGLYLAEVSGWNTDIPAMFGFDHRVPGGFRIGVYGF